MLFRFFLCLTVFFSVNCAFANSDTASKSSLGVACINVITKGGQSIIGSGFFVANGWVASSAHQIGNAKSILIHTKKSGSFDAQEVIVDDDEDIALIKTNAPSDHVLPLSPPATEVYLGQPVFTIGCPYGLEHSLSRGVISHEGRMINNRMLIQTDVQVASGSSGGPLLDENGNVLGVFHGVLEESKNISFVIPVEKLHNAMEKIGITSNKNMTTVEDDSISALWQEAGKTKNLKEKKQLYQAIINKAPWMVEAYYNLGIVNYQEQNFIEAENNLKKAMELKPDYYKAMVNLGLALKMQKKTKEALSYLEKSVLIDDKNPLAYYNIGLIYKDDLKDINLAKQAFLRYIELEKDTPEKKQIKEWLALQTTKPN